MILIVIVCVDLKRRAVILIVIVCVDLKRRAVILIVIVCVDLKRRAVILIVIVCVDCTCSSWRGAALCASHKEGRGGGFTGSCVPLKHTNTHNCLRQ